jgi:homoserine kinase
MRVRVRVPASSANLGPGFDALGLALALHNEVTAEEADGVSVTAEGEGAARLAAGARNVVARGVRMAYDAAGRAFPGCALACVNRIPLARGLGGGRAGGGGKRLCGGNHQPPRAKILPHGDLPHKLGL